MVKRETTLTSVRIRNDIIEEMDRLILCKEYENEDGPALNRSWFINTAIKKYIKELQLELGV